MRHLQRRDVRHWGNFQGIQAPTVVGAHCPHCGERVMFSLGEGSRDDRRRLLLFSATCPACPGRISLLCVLNEHSRVVELYMHPSGEERRSPKEFGESVPEALKRSYASTVQSFAERNYVATAVGSRRTLEGIFRYALPLEHQSLPLARMIEKVVETQDLSRPLLTLSHAIRQGGNLGAHFDPDREPTAEQARQMVDLLEYLIEYLYTLPGDITRLEEALSDRPHGEAG